MYSGYIGVESIHSFYYLHMPWQTKVPLWVLSAVSQYVIPDDSDFSTSSSFQKLDDAVDFVTTSQQTFSFDYPGLIPNVTLKSEIVPTEAGANISLIVSKAIGFYGVLSEVITFDPKKLNAWTFPLERRNFGYLALARKDKVSLDQPIHYSKQYHIDGNIVGLASNYDVERSSDRLTNDVDNFSLDSVNGFLNPSVNLQLGFLPIQEEWAVRFFQKDS